ncbi:MAG: heme-copper oxidase subunit III [Flavobacteriales bacterium]
MSTAAMHDSISANGNKNAYPRDVTERTAKMMLGFGIAAIVMMFGGLTSAVIVSKGGTFWVNFKLPSAFWISTAVIVFCSLVMNIAVMAIKRDKKALSRYMIILTFCGGIGFTVLQFIGYGQLVENGYYLSEKVIDPYSQKFHMKGEYGTDFTVQYKGEQLEYKNGLLYFQNRTLTMPELNRLSEVMNTSSSYFYLLCFLHILHLLGGLIYLMLVMFRSIQNKFDSTNCLKIKLSAIYWHFLGLLWIYLFVFLQFIH